MYGKTYKFHNSPALAPAEALLVSSSPAFDELHDDIKKFILACFYRKLLKKRRPHGEREPTIVISAQSTFSFLHTTRSYSHTKSPGRKFLFANSSSPIDKTNHYISSSHEVTHLDTFLYKWHMVQENCRNHQ